MDIFGTKLRPKASTSRRIQSNEQNLPTSTEDELLIKNIGKNQSTSEPVNLRDHHHHHHHHVAGLRIK